MLIDDIKHLTVLGDSIRWGSDGGRLTVSGRANYCKEC